MEAERDERERRTAKFWTADMDVEWYGHATVDEALEEYCGGFLDGEIAPGKTIRVFGTAPMELPPLDRLCTWLDPLDNILENLDEEFGADDSSGPTPAMQQAARELLSVVRSEYVVRASDIVEIRQIDLYRWCEEHHPNLCKKDRASR